MYQVCVVIQYVGIIMMLLGLVYLLQQWPSRPQSFMLFLGLAVLVNLLGYLFEITASTMESALTATKLSYLGKVYIPPLAFFFVLNYCKIRVPKALVVALTFVHTAVLVFVMTCEYHNLFYTTISFMEEGVFPHLEHIPVFVYNLPNLIQLVLNLFYLFLPHLHQHMQPQTSLPIYQLTLHPIHHLQIVYLSHL